MIGEAVLCDRSKLISKYTIDWAKSHGNAFDNIEAPLAERKASGNPSEGGGINRLGFRFIPLSRAEHQCIEWKRLADLFERSEFPRDPFGTLTRRMKRDTGGFFWFVFFYAEENEQTKKKPHPGSA